MQAVFRSPEVTLAAVTGRQKKQWGREVGHEPATGGSTGRQGPRNIIVVNSEYLGKRSNLE